MNELVFQLAVVFTPGLIWASIADILCTRIGARSTFRTAVRAFGFGMITYMIYFLGFRALCGAWPGNLANASGAPGMADFQALLPRDIIIASSVSVALSILWSWAANRKAFLRVMHKLQVTRKFGDEGVWEYALNMGTPAVEFVNVRDFENGIVYSGYVKAFSEGGPMRELLLDDVRVFDLASGHKLFEMPLVYVSRKREALHVEFPYIARDQSAVDPVRAEEQKHAG